MHDPSTVAFTIKSPISWLRTRFQPKGDGRLGSSYRYVSPMITIWHEDPMEWGDNVRGRSDDSCGWFRPPYTKAKQAAIKKLAREEFGNIWARLAAIRDGKDYAYVCNMPEDCYEAIYWSWRAIKQHERPRGRWRYHQRGLTVAELSECYDLATNPVDNLKMRFAEVSDEESCEDWFLLIYSCYLRFNRRWWQHPRWHVHHWSIQVHLWQTFRRWAFSRCNKCGGRFAWGESPIGSSWDPPKPRWFCSEVDVAHMDCSHPGGVGAAAQAQEPVAPPVAHIDPWELASRRPEGSA